eukprot:3777946-Amphidinium_carterae.1
MTDLNEYKQTFACQLPALVVEEALKKCCESPVQQPLAHPPSWQYTHTSLESHSGMQLCT